jgi:hypothetical protein
VKQIPLDFTMGEEVLDGGDSGTIVAVEPIKEDIDGCENIAFLFGFVLFGRELVTISKEGGKESQEELWVKLGEMDR